MVEPSMATMRVTILLLLGALAGSCGSAESSADAEGSGADSPEVSAPTETSTAEPRATVDAPWSPEEGWGTVSLDGSYWVTYLLHGEAVYDDEIPLNEDFEVEVRVFDAETRSQTVGGVDVRVDAQMPIHGHGMKQDARAVRQPDGSWRAKPMLLHMTGPWEIHVDITRGALTERAQFEIDLE